MIRIILVDDHALVRDGVSRLLEAQRDLIVVGSFGDGEEALQFVRREAPDLAILDVAMPNGSGIELARRLREAAPDTQLIVLSMHSDAAYVQQALAAGVTGYVAKDSPGAVLVAAVRQVCDGQRFLDTVAGKALSLGTGETAAPAERLGLLSEREREVLRYTVEGRTIAETAQALGLSPKSVETYRSRMMNKLGIDDLPSLVKFAIRHGITSV